MENDMGSKLRGLAVVTLAAIAGCNSSLGIPSCDANTTTATFYNEPSISATVTSITGSGTSKVIKAVGPSIDVRFTVTDATAVFERVGDGAPTAASSCRLAIGEVVELPLGLFIGVGGGGDPPAPTIAQLVIER
jgi:hypothetical protein